MRTMLVAAILVAGCLGVDTSDPSSHTPPDQTLPAGGSVAWGGLEAPLRPGAYIGWCTWGFLFFDDHGRGYAATAAHCTEEEGQRMPVAGFGEVGTVVFDADERNLTPYYDVSMVVLDDTALANPTMLGLVATTDTDQAVRGDPIAVSGYAQGFRTFEETRVRPGVLSYHDDRFGAWMPAGPGDSGGPVALLETGAAIGIVSGLPLVDMPPTTVTGPSVGTILALLAEAGHDLRLATT